jgi:heme a synthase
VTDQPTPYAQIGVRISKTAILEPKTFRWLVILTTVFTFAQISLGAAVRVSGSGLGCGNDWPVCHGQLIPPDNTKAIVEYAHRTVGTVTGGLLLLTLVVGWLTFRRRQPGLVWLVGAAAALIVVEGGLGALVVFKDLSGPLVLAHLAVALALIALLLAAAILSASKGKPLLDRSVRSLSIASVAVTYILLLTGAGVVATGADEVCRSWPFCGSGIPANLSGVAVYTIIHRLFAGIAGLFILFTLVQSIGRHRSVRYLRTVAASTAALLLIQMGIGYPTAVMRNLPLVDALHVAIATAVWCGVVGTALLIHRGVPIDSGTVSDVMRVAVNGTGSGGSVSDPDPATTETREERRTTSDTLSRLKAAPWHIYNLLNRQEAKN